MVSKTIVLALGGNAIQTGNGATAEDQKQACSQTAKQLVELIKEGHRLVLTHGNGPQVGNIVLQQQMSQSETLPAMPLDTCGAMSQGMIGYWLQNAIYEVLKENNIKKNVVSLVTQVLVDSHDPAFENPTKPIGSFFTKEEADRLAETNGYKMIEDSGRGYRRVVPSPQPIDILEKEAINDLLAKDHLIIAGGGGGIPVSQKGNQLEGIEAVIDKDFASEKLAEMIDADMLLILTGVENIAINFGKENEKKLTHISAAEAKQYMEEGHFPPGSMLPKVKAALQFVESKNERKSIVTSLEHAYEAIQGKKGTVIEA
ncbi:carbamate kinase [Bacillus changyiensis]|uniref:carbamate kinase n=1 Tax=Bacillus changyiensis TaxID=3004103 RepID=UPI0022E02D1E|nr:carbamate kinase [Bacillus changyiensis]MDA1476492.1 carbamate kinase [Bacillus changyiensis]